MIWFNKIRDGVFGSLPVGEVLKYLQYWPYNKDVEDARIKQDIKRKEIWGPFRPIPNVREFRVEVSNWDRLFMLFGIAKRRFKPKLVYKPHCNKSLNRYMEHQLKRMMNLMAKPYSGSYKALLYWRIGMHLVRKSNVFYVMALNHVFPRWHRDMSMSGVLRLAIETRRIANIEDENLPQLDYRRVYIPKSGGEWRPLGVPSAAWRIYLHMINQIYVHFQGLFGYLDESQHGFRPNRGTATALKDVLTKVIPSKDIFEFDLKEFFSRVNLDAVSMKLVEQNVPINIIRRLYYINSSACAVKPPYLLNEFEHMIRKLLHKKASFKEVVEHPRPLSYMYRLKGLPQGAPTSPALSLIVLDKAIVNRPNLPTLMYADDGLYYGDLLMEDGSTRNPIITPNSQMVTANIYFNHNKSGWVKRNGEWIKPLKFLGLEYDGKTDSIKASTRKGSSLVFDKWELLKALNGRDGISISKNWETESISHSWGVEIREKVETADNWENFIRSKYYGWILSKLYFGAWETKDFAQSFEMKYVPRSWASRNNDIKINVFNSTSFACEWLSRKMRTLKFYRPKLASHQGK